MFESIASFPGFLMIILFFGIGAVGSLLLHNRNELANWWSNGWAIAGSLWGMLFAASIFVTGQSVSGGTMLAGLPLVSISFHIDQLAAFFIFVISLIALF